MKRRNFLQASGLFPFIATALATNISAAQSATAVTINSEETERDFFYKPVGAWAADFIPLYADGAFQLFYLLDWRDGEKHGEGTPWYRLSTTDFVTFTEHGEVLPRGTVKEQDLYVFTGSAIQAKDQYHIFYTGNNPHLREAGQPEQGVMHATSSDLQKWTKIPADTFFSPADKYEKNDWRDPFVFYNEEEKQYNMLLAARFSKGIPRRRGLTALCTSKDLVKWEVKEPFYAPDLYYTHECPDLFKIGDWWYLLFSEFTDLVATRYRMSKSLKGPWITPAQDTFDGHAFYAAKTASDGKNRYIFGWNPTRDSNKDDGGWQWGGNLVVHQIIQQPNGELTVRVPATVANAFKNTSTPQLTTYKDGSIITTGALQLSASNTFNAAVGDKLPSKCKISTTVTFTKNTRDFGCMLHCSNDLDTAYYIRLEPAKNRLVFDMWPRNRLEVSFMAELERTVGLKPGVPVTLQVFVDGTAGVVYVNDIVAMNFRMYDLKEGNWGLFATDGSAQFTKTTIATL